MKIANTIIAFLFLVSNLAVAEPVNNFPIMLICHNNAGDILDVKLSPAKNMAYLSYKRSEKSLSMSITDPRGYNSGASVEIKSFSSPGGNTLLQISAQMNEVFRVTNYAQFVLELVVGNDGALKPKGLSYAKGCDALPKDAVQDTVNLQDMHCSLSGL